MVENLILTVETETGIPLFSSVGHDHYSKFVPEIGPWPIGNATPQHRTARDRFYGSATFFDGPFLSIYSVPVSRVVVMDDGVGCWEHASVEKVVDEEGQVLDLKNISSIPPGAFTIHLFAWPL